MLPKYDIDGSYPAEQVDAIAQLMQLKRLHIIVIIIDVNITTYKPLFRNKVVAIRMILNDIRYFIFFSIFPFVFISSYNNGI